MEMVRAAYGKRGFRPTSSRSSTTWDGNSDKRT